MKRLLATAVLAFAFAGCTVGYSSTMDAVDTTVHSRRVESVSQGFAILSVCFGDGDIFGQGEGTLYGLSVGNGIWLQSPRSAFDQLQDMVETRGCKELKNITVDYNQEMNLLLVAFPTIRVSANCIRDIEKAPTASVEQPEREGSPHAAEKTDQTPAEVPEE